MSKYADFYTQAFMMQRIRSDINAHKRFSDTNELLRKLTVKGMEEIVPLFYAVSRSYKVKFPEELEEGTLDEYLERQALNFMQEAVDICLPGYAEPRVMALPMNDIRLKGFAKDVETYLRVHDGLTSALGWSRQCLNSKAYTGRSAEEGDLS